MSVPRMWDLLHAFATAALLAMISTVHAQSDTQRVFRQVSPSVVTVLALDENGKLEGQGSGIIVASGKVITNCHVVRDAQNLKVRQGKSEVAATWSTRDPSRDLCLLTVANLDGPAVRLRPYKELAVGERAFAVGNPLGFELSVSEGLIASLANVRNEPTIITNAPLSPGSSGGGLFDAEGRLIGVTTAILGVGQNLNIVLPADGITELNTRGTPARPVRPPPAAEPRWREEAEALQAKLDWKALEPYARKWLEAHPTSSKAGFFLGVAVMQQGRKEEAEIILRNALRNDAHDATAWSYLAHILRDTGRRDEANKALDRAMAIRTESYFYLARTEWLQAEKRFDEAKVAIDRAIALQPGAEELWMKLGFIESNRQQLAAAARAFRVALRLNPKHERARPALADVLTRAGQVNQARESLGGQAASGDTRSGLATTSVWLALGNKELAANRFADAESAYRKVLEAAPDSHQAWWGLGSVFERSGRTAEAEDAFYRALKIKSDYGAPYWSLGRIQESRGDLQTALASYKAAAEHDPANPAAWGTLANLAHQMRDFRQSAAAYQRVVDLGKPSAPVYVRLGDALLRTEQTERAREAMQAAEKLAPDDPLVLLGMATLLGMTGEHQRALEFSERAVGKSPSAEGAWSSKGYSLLKLGRIPEAITALETAVGLNPKSVNALINLGEAKLRNKEFGAAIRAEERALEINPNALDARYIAAQAYFAVKQVGKTREHLQAMLAQVPEFPQALAMMTLAAMVESKNDEAVDYFTRLKAKNPALAAELRKQALGITPAAKVLPE